MPVARYFLFVGGLLLGLLFLADWYFPKLIAPPATAGVDKTVIRLHSAHKWPEATVFDTSLPTIVPPAPTTAAAEIHAPTTARPAMRAFAMALPETAVPVRVEPSPIARKHLHKRRPRTAAVHAHRLASDESFGSPITPPAGW